MSRLFPEEEGKGRKEGKKKMEGHLSFKATELPRFPVAGITVDHAA